MSDDGYVFKCLRLSPDKGRKTFDVFSNFFGEGTVDIEQYGPVVFTT